MNTNTKKKWFGNFANVRESSKQLQVQSLGKSCFVKEQQKLFSFLGVVQKLVVFAWRMLLKKRTLKVACSSQTVTTFHAQIDATFAVLWLHELRMFCLAESLLCTLIFSIGSALFFEFVVASSSYRFRVPKERDCNPKTVVRPAWSYRSKRECLELYVVATKRL